MSESENSARPRCDFIYTKNSARPGSGFYLHKEQVGAILKKMAVFIKENALRPVENHDMESQKQLGGDASENGDFQRGKQRLQGRKNFQINFDEFLGTNFSGANVGGRC